MMVKGISRQVIVVHSPDRQFFDQAIFILKDGQQGVTDEMLLKEAKRLINTPSVPIGQKLWRCGPVWACGGAFLTGLAWLLTALL